MPTPSVSAPRPAGPAAAAPPGAARAGSRGRCRPPATPDPHRVGATVTATSQRDVRVAVPDRVVDQVEQQHPQLHRVGDHAGLRAAHLAHRRRPGRARPAPARPASATGTGSGGAVPRPRWRSGAAGRWPTSSAGWPTPYGWRSPGRSGPAAPPGGPAAARAKPSDAVSGVLRLWLSWAANAASCRCERDSSVTVWRSCSVRRCSSSTSTTPAARVSSAARWPASMVCGSVSNTQTVPTSWPPGARSGVAA